VAHQCRDIERRPRRKDGFGMRGEVGKAERLSPSSDSGGPERTRFLDRQSDVTVAALPVPLEDARSFGVIDAYGEVWIRDFKERPADPPAMPTDPTRAYASMGNHLFDAKVLVQALEVSLPRDLATGQRPLPRCTGCGR
jgi:hypothetical protein